ncbi:MAG: UvrD-helicase domain-containing protein, partial [Gemmatimonadota bacterium]|nr:UvrD-helicase domain-containing protein [Gemmatimonadota bacterium]
MINAGAGTGKTFTVIAKILYLLGVETRGTTIPEPMGLRDIAAITYTNKAASELKEKLRSSLRAAGRRSEAYQVDVARVGTIHSFCGDILRDFALRSGRSPALTLIGEADGKVMATEAVRDTLLEVLETNSVAGLTDILSIFPVRDVERWATQLLGHGDSLESMLVNDHNRGANEAALLQLAVKAHGLLMRRLDEAAQMDYDRMIVWTRDLLRDDATVRKALRRRIRVLIIDECQDVDPIQREIAYLLADPTRRRTDTTRLVLVGDPKQSIYRFRKADVTVWRSIESDLESSGTGRVINLAESRRSIAPVLGFVDDFVGTLLDKPSDAEKGQQNFEVPYAPLNTLRDESDTDSESVLGVEFIGIPALENGKACNAPIVRRTEAREIARRVNELCSQGLEPRDIAVLLGGWADAGIYMDALRRAGIPAYSLRAEGFWGCREVLDVTVALAAVLDPSDDRVLTGFLRSPFAGVTDESLLHIARQARSPYWENMTGVTLPDPEERARLAHAVQLLERLGGIRDRVGLVALIEELLAVTGYLVHLELLGYTGDGSPDQRIANVRKLVHVARAHDALTVGDFLTMIARERDLEIREGEALLHGERDNVVTVTSVHSAKGLEWRCVFWADLIRAPSAPGDKLVIHGSRIVLGDPDIKAEQQPDEWQAVRKAILAEEDAETRRVWYVAATRARDLLILSGIPLGTGGRTKGSPAAALLNRFDQLDAAAEVVRYQSASGIEYSAIVRHAEPLEDEVSGDIGDTLSLSAQETSQVEASALEITHPWQKVSVQFGRGRYSASELMSFQKCERRHWLKRVAGLDEPVVTMSDAGSDIAASGGMSAIQYGVIVHDVLEHADDDVDIGELVDAAASRWEADRDSGRGVDPAERQRLV